MKKKYYSFLVSQRDKKYYFTFLPVCTYCGRHADGVTSVAVSEQLGLVSSSTSFKIPYCAEHLAVIRKFIWMQRGIYLFSFILALTVFYWWGIRPGAPLFIGGPILWGITFYPFFKYVVIKLLFMLIDKGHHYDSETNTLDFTASMEIGGLVLSFSDAAIAQKFAMANWRNPLIRPLEGSVMDTILRDVIQPSTRR